MLMQLAPVAVKLRRGVLCTFVFNNVSDEFGYKWSYVSLMHWLRCEQ